MLSRFPYSILSLALAFFIAGLLLADHQETRVPLRNAQGQSVGTATITPASSAAANQGVRIDLDLTNQPPGEHAVHIHAKAVCDPPDFESAGPHFNPDNKSHGEGNPQGPHAGDLKNVSVGSDGKAKATLTATKVSLSKTEKNSLFTGDGTSIVIHEKADDNKSDPAGNAGARIACGAIK